MALRRALWAGLKYPRHAHFRSRDSGRCCSSLSNVILDTDERRGVTTLKLNRPPVNSLNLDLLQDIVTAVDRLERDPRQHGLIITSNIPGVFCAGLEISEMYKPEMGRLMHFWGAVQEWWTRLYGSRLIVMSAINGHSPGAGCMMAMCSDYRLMASGKYTIGLNETRLGLVCPTWSYFFMTMVNTVGWREAERALQQGLVYSGPEALRVGLVDELLPQSELMETAQLRMDQWLRIPEAARQTTKMQMRQETLELLSKRRQEDVDTFINLIMQNSVQKKLGMYLDSLNKRTEK